jgi:hypothetical protein
MDKAEICKALDKRKIPVLASLKKLGFSRWAPAWQDMFGRQAIQQLFTKRQTAVKFQTHSK